MSSLTKSESARINGAKSHGPKTDAGRKRSSQNALKHGLTAQTLVLPTEDPAEFDQLLSSYLDQFRPDGPAESDLVHEMVAAQWRLQRLAIIETQLYIESMEHAEENADRPLSSGRVPRRWVHLDGQLQFFQRPTARRVSPGALLLPRPPQPDPTPAPAPVSPAARQSHTRRKRNLQKRTHRPRPNQRIFRRRQPRQRRDNAGRHRPRPSPRSALTTSRAFRTASRHTRSSSVERTISGK